MALSTTPTIFFAIAAVAPLAGVAGLLWLAETRDPLFSEVDVAASAPASAASRKEPLLSARRRRILVRYARAVAGVAFICSLVLGVVAAVVVLGLVSKEDSSRRAASRRL